MKTEKKTKLVPGVKKKPDPRTAPKTTLADLANGNVRVTHSQSLKRNYDYNSAEAVYGLEVEVEPEKVTEAVKLMENMVQELLLPKSEKQLDYLIRNGRE